MEEIPAGGWGLITIGDHHDSPLWNISETISSRQPAFSEIQTKHDQEMSRTAKFLRTTKQQEYKNSTTMYKKCIWYVVTTMIIYCVVGIPTLGSPCFPKAWIGLAPQVGFSWWRWEESHYSLLPGFPAIYMHIYIYPLVNVYIHNYGKIHHAMNG